MIRLIKRQNRPQKPTFYFNFTSPLRAFGDCCCSHVNSSPKVYSSSRGHRTGSNNSGVEELVHHSGKTIMRTCEYTKHSSSAHHNCVTSCTSNKMYQYCCITQMMWLVSRCAADKSHPFAQQKSREGTVSNQPNPRLRPERSFAARFFILLNICADHP